MFECFHNFVAFSQWGNTIFGIILRLAEMGAIQPCGLPFRRNLAAWLNRRGFVQTLGPE